VSSLGVRAVLFDEMNGVCAMHVGNGMWWVPWMFKGPRLGSHVAVCVGDGASKHTDLAAFKPTPEMHGSKTSGCVRCVMSVRCVRHMISVSSNCWSCGRAVGLLWSGRCVSLTLGRGVNGVPSTRLFHGHCAGVVGEYRNYGE
jgi:hypothetical protein